MEVICIWRYSNHFNLLRSLIEKKQLKLEIPEAFIYFQIVNTERQKAIKCDVRS